MVDLIFLEGIELIPVLELEPSTFSTRSRQSPQGTSGEVPDEWFRYWTDSLADSGIIGLHPLRPGSWSVPTMNFDGAGNLHAYLKKTFEEWGGIESLSDPERRHVLNGGLALHCSTGDLLIPPGCCCDLDNVRDWKEGAAYRRAEWKMVWIGHPWISIHYHHPWLVVSEPHESDAPSERWAVSPDELDRAADDAIAELERFAAEMSPALDLLGYRGDPLAMGRQLVGLRV